MKKLLSAMALGAGLAWAFDPDTGSRRRDAIRRKLDQRGASHPDATPTPLITVPGSADAAPRVVAGGG